MRTLNPMNTSWSNQSLAPRFMGDVIDDFERIVDSFLRPVTANTVNFQPRCDINETQEAYLVSFDMPGVKKEDLHIEVRNNQLHVSGERHKSSQHEGALRFERMYGKFERVFSLPSTIDTEKVEAHYEDGVLNIALPKVETAKGRTIEIQANKNQGLISKLLGTKKTTPELKDAKAS